MILGIQDKLNELRRQEHETVADAYYAKGQIEALEYVLGLCQGQVRKPAYLDDDAPVQILKSISDTDEGVVYTPCVEFQPVTNTTLKT